MLSFKAMRTCDFSLSGNNSDRSESNSDLEDAKPENQTYRPFRDKNPDAPAQASDEEYQSNKVEETGTSTMRPEMIRKKVKQSLAKKQQKARRTKRGEAGVVTRKRRENRSAIKQSGDGIW